MKSENSFMHRQQWSTDGKLHSWFEAGMTFGICSVLQHRGISRFRHAKLFDLGMHFGTTRQHRASNLEPWPLSLHPCPHGDTLIDSTSLLLINTLSANDRPD